MSSTDFEKTYDEAIEALTSTAFPECNEAVWVIWDTLQREVAALTVKRCKANDLRNQEQESQPHFSPKNR